MVTWTWREDEFPSAPAQESAGGARLRGTIQGGVGIAIAAAVYFFLSGSFGLVIFCVAAIIALSALISPEGLFAGIEALFRSTALVVGRFLTWILLPAIFYGFFLPFRVLFRRGRRDSMKRFYDSEAATYWTPREPREDGLDFYRRQF